MLTAVRLLLIFFCAKNFYYSSTTALIQDGLPSLHNLFQEVQKLEAKISDIERRCDSEHVKEKIQSMNNILTSLVSSNQSQSEETISLHNDITEFDDRLTQLEVKQREVLFRVKTMGQIQALRSEENHMSASPQGINKNGSVAFYAVVSEVLTNLRDDKKIPFETKHVDTYGTFHGSDGIFVCPHNGTYAFFTTILTYPGVRLEYNIMKNGQWFAAGYTKGDLTSNTFDSGTTSGIVYLQRGDQVWVQLLHRDGYEGSENMVFKEYSSFMGFSLTLE